MRLYKLPSQPESVASQVVGDIKHICEHFENRIAGSESERAAAEFLVAKLGEGINDVRVERFNVHPRAYFGWIDFTASCLMLAFAAYFFSALISIMLFLVGLVPFFAEYVLKNRMCDPLFKKETSENVYAVKHCSGEVRRRIVFVSHYDAGNEWRLKRILGATAFKSLFLLGIIGAFYLLVIDVVRWALVGGLGAGIAYGAMLIAGLVGIVFIIPWGAAYFFLDRKKVTDGANDGLSGAVTSVYALNALKDVELEHTEVALLLAGSGEAGMRGAMAFLDAHKNEFSDETFFVSVDILHDSNNFAVSKSEADGFVKSDAHAIGIALDAAKSAGIECKSRNVFSSAQSRVFSSAGLRSVSINAASKQMTDGLHTRKDCRDDLSEECISKGYEFALQLIAAYDGDVEFEFSNDDISAI